MSFHYFFSLSLLPCYQRSCNMFEEFQLLYRARFTVTFPTLIGVHGYCFHFSKLLFPSLSLSLVSATLLVCKVKYAIHVFRLLFTAGTSSVNIMRIVPTSQYFSVKNDNALIDTFFYFCIKFLHIFLPPSCFFCFFPACSSFYSSLSPYDILPESPFPFMPQRRFRRTNHFSDIEFLLCPPTHCITSSFLFFWRQPPAELPLSSQNFVYNFVQVTFLISNVFMTLCCDFPIFFSTIDSKMKL